MATATWVILLASGCSPSAPLQNSPGPIPAVSREILVELNKWDAATTSARRAAAEDVSRRLPDFALLRSETFSCGGQTHEVAIYSHAKTGLEFVLVPGGIFAMGSPESETDRSPGETLHRVWLTQPFLIARTHCTQAAYAKVVGSNPSNFKGPTLPVEQVSWDDATSFCGKAGLELPTEAQWEYACRAGTTTAFGFGDDARSLGFYAWHPENSDRTTHPVGEKKPNAFGLYDMHGNVFQWCQDWCGDYPTGPVTDPIGATNAEMRVLRGGSYSHPARDARCAYHGRNDPDSRTAVFGFRPAKTVPID